MKINQLPKYQDVRGKLVASGSYRSYPITEKEWLVIHHSATLSGSAEAFARYHDGLWGRGLGYHFVIEKDGTIKQGNDLDDLTYHVGNYNKRSIGICLVGDFRVGKQKPTQEQMDSLYLLVKAVREEVPSITRVMGHQEVPGYSWKNCPGDNWSYQEVVAGNGVSDSIMRPNAHIIATGDTLWGISRKYNIPLNDILKMNPNLNPTTLKVGDVVSLIMETQKPKPVVPPKPSFVLPTKTLRYGDRGTDVKQLQIALNKVYFNCGKPDGIFGKGTLDALKRFQSVYCNPVDGVYGYKTRLALGKKLNG